MPRGQSGAVRRNRILDLPISCAVRRRRPCRSMQKPPRLPARTRTTLPARLRRTRWPTSSTPRVRPRRPKGSLLVHRGLCNFAQGLIHALGINEEQRVLQFASFSFDMSLMDIFGALAAGATLCLTDQETLASPDRFAEYARRQRITLATLPPALLMVMRPEEFPTLETVISGGDRCPVELANSWGRVCRFVNAYGPTETSVAVALGVCEGTYTESPPIGKTVAQRADLRARRPSSTRTDRCGRRAVCRRSRRRPGVSEPTGAHCGAVCPGAVRRGRPSVRHG